MVISSIVAAILVGSLLAAAWLSTGKLERLFFYISGYFLSSDVQANVALAAPVGPTTWRTVNGDLVTYLKVRGARRLIGKEDFNRMSERLADMVAIKLRDGTGTQHALATGYLSDPPGTPHVIRNLLRGAVTTAQRMGAWQNAQVWFDNKAAFMSELCNDESVIMAIYTLKSGLSPKESERYAQWMQDMRDKVNKSFKEAGIAARAGDAADAMYHQPLSPVYPVLDSRHRAVVSDFIQSIENESGGIGVLVDELACDEAIYHLKRFVSGRPVPVNWRPNVFGKQAPHASALQREGDLGHMMPPPIARQIFTEPLDEDFTDYEVAKMEGTWFGSLKLDYAPAEDPAPPFSELATKMGRNFPWAGSWELTPNGTKQKQTDQMFAGFFGGFGAHNRALKDAWKWLKAYEEHGGYVAAMRLVCTTWARDQETLNEQLSVLKQALQGWGSTTASNESGAPGNLFVATAPTLARYYPAPFLPGPLPTFARMLPLYRAASPWDQGQLLLRTNEGKPYPISFGSPIQAFWGTLIFAPPGRGKSFLMNTLNAGLLFSPGLSDLPYIVIIDKGMSSANVIEMARGILPEDRKHQAISIRLRNTVEYAINIFDTQLGMDRPTERERDFQVNMVSALCPNLGDEGVAFVRLVIDTAYKNLDRNSLHARRWQRALDPAITEKIQAAGMEISEAHAPRVWDVVDKLFDLGDVHSAIQAQRFAVPVLDDLIKAANAQQVQDQYCDAPSKSGKETITPAFIRSINNAMSEYALISTYTRFDIGDARVISVDLEEVLASTTSEEGRRRAAIMILFARQLGARNFFLKWDEMEKDVPERYKRYQFARVNNIFETLKFLEYDEFHNATGMVDVLRMVKSDFREGRKYNVVPLLSSQLFQDFDKDLVETANNFFVLGVGSAEAANDIRETFELSEAERNCILYECTGPSKKGAPLFGMFKTDKGTVSQLLWNSVSAMEIWAFNSSAMDVAVRKSVLAGLGGNYWGTLKSLTDQFPEGTARYEISRMREAMTAQEAADENGIAATLARKIIERIQRESRETHEKATV